MPFDISMNSLTRTRLGVDDKRRGVGRRINRGLVLFVRCGSTGREEYKYYCWGTGKGISITRPGRSGRRGGFLPATTEKNTTPDIEAAELVRRGVGGDL